MLNKYRKFVYAFLIVIILVFIFFYIGVFDFIFHDKFNSIADTLKNSYYNYLQLNKQNAMNISKDEILINTLIQYQFDRNVFQALRQLNIYLKNYDSIKRISIFNYDYNIIITSDMGNYTVNKGIKPEWFAKSSEKNEFISSIYFDESFKTYMFSIVVPIKNFMNEIVGYIVSDIDLRYYLNEVNEYRAVNLVAYDNSGILFSLHNSYNLSVANLKSQFKFFKIFYVREQNLYFLLGAGKTFVSISASFKIVLWILFVLLFFIIAYDILERVLNERMERRKKIQNSIKKVLEHSKKINVENISVLENMRKSPVKPETEKEVKDFIKERAGAGETENQKKNSNVKEKVKNEFKNDFVIIE